MRRFYEGCQEAGRLETPFFRWEKVRTLDLLDRFLPPAPALILDVGGAAGAYAFALAERGYVVDRIDPVLLHIEQAKQRALVDQRAPRSFQVGMPAQSVVTTERLMTCSSSGRSIT